jgi:two-component system, LytTR family, response regulator
VSAQIPTLVVDDEPLALKRMLKLLATDPEIRVVGGCASADEAIECAAGGAPQLLLLDIRMPRLDGFGLITQLAQRGVHPCVIFVTAYADRSMDAFGVGAIDYLVKPFDDERFARAIARAKALLASGRTAAAAPAAPAAVPDRTRLMLSERGRVVVLVTRDIEFIQAAAKHVRIFAGGRCFTLRYSLADLEARLDPGSFVRVHRSTVVNVDHIAEMHPMFHGDCELVMRRGTRLTLSRRYRERLAPFLLK